MYTTKFTTIVSLLVLGAMANGPKPAASHSQLPASANAEFKSDLENAPSGATLHTASKLPKAMKLPNKLVKAASTKNRSAELEHDGHENHDPKLRSTESRMDGDKAEGFADSISKIEGDDSAKGKTEEESKLPTLAKILSSDSLPSQEIINKAREEIQSRLKTDQADIKREIAALMVLSQEQNILDQVHKIKIIAPLELSDMLLSGSSGFGAPLSMSVPIFPMPGQPGPAIPNESELNSLKPSEKSEEDERPSGKLHASSIRQPTVIPSHGLERLENDDTVVLIEQDSEMDTAHPSQSVDMSDSPIPPSMPASDAQSTPGKLVDMQPASEAQLPASTGPQSPQSPQSPPASEISSPASTGPQAAPNAPANLPQANQQPQTPPQSQPQPQGQQSPIIQSQPSAPSDPKDSTVNTEGTAME